jgi:hypothetical protein
MRALTFRLLSTTVLALTVACAEAEPVGGDAAAPAILDAGAEGGAAGCGAVAESCSAAPDPGDEDLTEVEPVASACPDISDAKKKAFAGMGELAAACARWDRVGPYAYILDQQTARAGDAGEPTRITTYVVDGEVQGARINGRPAETGPSMLSTFAAAAEALRDKAWDTEIAYDAETGAIVEVALKEASAKQGWNVVTIDIYDAADGLRGVPPAM